MTEMSMDSGFAEKSDSRKRKGSIKAIKVRQKNFFSNN